jgi:hypothetical protein
MLTVEQAEQDIHDLFAIVCATINSRAPHRHLTDLRRQLTKFKHYPIQDESTAGLIAKLNATISYAKAFRAGASVTVQIAMIEKVRALALGQATH